MFPHAAHEIIGHADKERANSGVMPSARAHQAELQRFVLRQRLDPGVRGDERTSLVQILSGNLMMKLSRLGIFTFGRVCASIVSCSPISLLR
jgi:hypothetical protein